MSKTSFFRGVLLPFNHLSLWARKHFRHKTHPRLSANVLGGFSNSFPKQKMISTSTGLPCLLDLGFQKEDLKKVQTFDL